MFTGIIEEIGTIAKLKKIGGGIRITVVALKAAHQLRINDSVSINGVCQTVVARGAKMFDVIAVEETLKKTTFGTSQSKQKVNIELPMRLNERLGGHLVLGHVDTVGHIAGIEERATSWMFSVKVPQNHMKYIVPIGSIAIDGVSLTIAELEENVVRVSIIPHTLSHTIFKFYKIGDAVNLEFDVLGKYIERLTREHLSGGVSRRMLNEKDLLDSGF